jgi:VanZ family protein
VGPIPEIPGKDKTIHFIAYLFAATMVVSAFIKKLYPSHALAFIFGLLLLAALDEVTQPIVGRSCDFYDWLADLGGIVLGTFFILNFMKKLSALQSHPPKDTLSVRRK